MARHCVCHDSNKVSGERCRTANTFCTVSHGHDVDSYNPNRSCSCLPLNAESKTAYENSVRRQLLQMMLI
jgi:hypothetical protein